MTGVTVVGVRGHLVAVEAPVGRGPPSLTLTGVPGARVSPEDVAVLERMMGVQAPNQERLVSRRVERALARHTRAARGTARTDTV